MNSGYCVEPLSAGWIMACCRTGASHLREGQPCQDAYATWMGRSQGRPFVIVAAADGHGDPRHDRSAIGAELAVRSAIEELARLSYHFDRPTACDHFVSTFQEDFPRRVTSRWREAVRMHAQPELCVGISSDLDQRVWKRYGTTLTAALVTQDWLLLGQIGDGAAVLASHEGKVEFVFSGDPNAVGTETASLCSSDAEKLWTTQVRAVPSNYAMLFLSTDGLLNSFVDQEGRHAFFYDFCQHVRKYGFARVAQEVPSWLDKFSAEGSGDDMTLVVLLMAHPDMPSSHRDESRQISSTSSSSEPPEGGTSSC